MRTGLLVSFLEGSAMRDSDFNKLESLPKKYKFYSISVKTIFCINLKILYENISKVDD